MDVQQRNLSVLRTSEIAHVLITPNAYGQVTKKSWAALAGLELGSMELE